MAQHHGINNLQTMRKVYKTCNRRVFIMPQITLNWIENYILHDETQEDESEEGYMSSKVHRFGSFEVVM